MSELYEEAVMKASALAKADFDANGHHANQPYTITVHGVRLKARIRHRTDVDKNVLRLEIYQPETYIGSQELSYVDIMPRTNNRK